MAIPPFTLGYPPDGSSLGNTKTTIRNNLDGEFLVVGVDHQTQNSVIPGAAGAHTKVSLVEISSSLPPNIKGGGFETIFAKITPIGAGFEGNIFFSRGGVGSIQLTGPGSPVPALNGYTFLPGGIILQWGVITPAVTGDNAILFTSQFPNALFTPMVSTDTDAANVVTVIKRNSLSTSGFTAIVSVLVPPTQPVTIFWTAIGN